MRLVVALAVLLALAIGRDSYGLGVSTEVPQKELLSQRAEEWIKLGEAELHDQRRVREALGHFQNALALAREADDIALLSRGWLGSSRAHLKLGQIEKGLSSAREAVAVARLAGDRLREAQALDEIGNAYFYLSDYANSLTHFQMALARIREVGDASGEANYLKDIGIAYASLGQLDLALFYLRKSAEKYKEFDERGSTVAVLGNLGSLYSQLGASRLALGAFQEALQIAEENQNPKETLDVQTRIGSLYLGQGFPEPALKHLEYALALVEELKMPLQEAWISELLGSAQAALGRREAAIAARSRALSLWRRIKNERSVRYNLCELGFLSLELDPETAADYFLQALKVPQQQDGRFVWIAHAGLGHVYRRRGDLARSIEAFEEAVHRLESFRGQLSSQEGRVSLPAKNQRIYHGLIEALLERHLLDPGSQDGVEAFNVSERARARILLEAISEARLGTEPQPPPELRRRDDQLKGRLAELRLHLADLRKTVSERRAVIEELARTELESDQLLAEIRRRRREGAALRPAAPLTLRQAQALLDDSTALLAYWLTGEKTFAFLVTAKSFHVERLSASPKELSERIRTGLDLIVQDKRSGLPGTARRLYQDLVEPLHQKFPPAIRELVIVPDGVLHFLPFETLMTGDTPPRYLLEDFAISYVPSATVLAELKTQGRSSKRGEQADLLFFGDPATPAAPPRGKAAGPARLARELYEEEGLPITPLAHAGSEARAIARYAGGGSKILTGREASEARLKGSRLDHFRVLHFATHGLISRWGPARSALVLASGGREEDDGFLQAREIYRLKGMSELVVLSACQTARGRIVEGEGVQGIARAFFSSGARTVVASLWNVNDKATADLMKAFYRRLAAGLPKAEALRRAKLDLLTRRATRAPRYWAPFILIGEPDGRVPIRGRPWLRQTPNWFLLAILLSLLAPSLILASKRRSKRGAVSQYPTSARAARQSFSAFGRKNSSSGGE